MITKPACLAVGLLLLAAACGGQGHGAAREAFTEEQEFLLGLQGTWVGTADDFKSSSGSDRLVLELSLPPDGAPALEGLTGSIRVGLDDHQLELDPDRPGSRSLQLDFVDGRVCELHSMAIVSNRFLARFRPVTYLQAFCAAQTSLYPMDDGAMKCSPTGPGWTGECGPTVETPNGEDCVYWGPDGEEVFVFEDKVTYCDECTCDAGGCSHEHGLTVQLDLTVDLEHHLLLGDGLGQIEAEKL